MRHEIGLRLMAAASVAVSAAACSPRPSVPPSLGDRPPGEIIELTQPQDDFLPPVDDPFLSRPRGLKVMLAAFQSDALGIGATIKLSLSPRETVTGSVVDLRRGTKLILRAKLFDGSGTIVLVEEKGILNGWIRLSDRVSEIRATRTESAFVADVSQEVPLPCPGPARDDRREPSLCSSEPSASPPLATVDILVLYTADAQQGFCRSCSVDERHRSITNHIVQCEEDMNDVLSGSGIPLRVATVAQAYPAYVETRDSQKDLDNLAATVAVPTSDVAMWRAAARADLVSLIVESTGGKDTGRANLPTDPIDRFAPTALSVVQRAASLAGWGFVHEIGHNLGAGHEETDENYEGYCHYSHGYLFKDTNNLKFKTVMACADGFKRKGLFSTPHPIFGGVANGSATADNVRTLTLTAPQIANLVR